MKKRKFQTKNVDRIVALCHENHIPINGQNISLGLRFISGDLVDALPREIDNYLLSKSHMDKRDIIYSKKKNGARFQDREDY